MASITAEVYAEDEGQALDKARDYAEDADTQQFSIFGEGNAEILSQE